MCFVSFQISLTFSLVFGVIVYRITTAAALSMSTNESTRSNVRVTVTATAVIINLVVILILDEIYGMVAKWLTKMGNAISPWTHTFSFFPVHLSGTVLSSRSIIPYPEF